MTKKTPLPPKSSHATDQMGQAEHPEPEQLLAYHREELQSDEADAIQEHVTACRDCANLLLDLPQLFGEDAPPDAHGDLDAAFKVLRDRAAHVSRVRREGPPRQDGAGRPSQRAWRFFRQPGSLALAASALLALFGWYRAHQQARSFEEQLDAATRPRFDVQIHDVAPSERDLDPAASNDEVAVTLDREVGQTILIFNPLGSFRHAEYEGRIVDSEGVVVVRETGLTPTPFQTFTLSLVAGSLEPGQYTIEVLGVGDEEDTLVGRWKLRVAVDDPSS